MICHTEQGNEKKRPMKKNGKRPRFTEQLKSRPFIELTHQFVQ